MFENLKERFLEKYKEILELLKETELYQKVEDSYQSLSPRKQNLILISAVGFLAFLIFSLPLSFLFNSSESIEKFEKKQIPHSKAFKNWKAKRHCSSKTYQCLTTQQ